MHGIVLIDKPQGITSAQVVSKLRKRLGERRIGHAGTLDPMATGLLVCLVGKPTRLASYAESGKKIYSGTILLGRVTDSDDVTGNTLREETNFPDWTEIIEKSKTFVGKLEQIPPRVSAVKIDGTRAYTLARRGEEVTIKPRQVTVDSFEIVRVDERRFSFMITCSKGTYIRSIARDIGEALECGGCLETLRREYSHPFSVKEAREIDSVESTDLRSWGDLFPSTPRATVSSELASALSGGSQSALKSLITGCKNEGSLSSADKYLVYSLGHGEDLGLLECGEEGWHYAVNIGLGEELKV